MTHRRAACHLCLALLSGTRTLSLLALRRRSSRSHLSAFGCVRHAGHIWSSFRFNGCFTFHDLARACTSPRYLAGVPIERQNLAEQPASHLHIKRGQTKCLSILVKSHPLRNPDGGASHHPESLWSCCVLLTRGRAQKTAVRESALTSRRKHLSRPDVVRCDIVCEESRALGRSSADSTHRSKIPQQK